MTGRSKTKGESFFTQDSPFVSEGFSFVEKNE